LRLVARPAIPLISRFLSRRAALDSRFAMTTQTQTQSPTSTPTPHYFTEPVLTLVSRPSFAAPEHLPVNWIGESTDGERLAEFAGRLCYMSQHNPAKRETREYLENIKKQGHGSVLEHANYTILLEGVSRSLTHELVRHRAGFAYSQLSQRYVDESVANFVVPPAIVGDERLEAMWREQMEQAQAAYIRLVAQLMERYGWIADKVHRRKMAREASRAVLPNATETKIVVTGNARAWRTMLELRSSEGAELEIRRMAVAVLRLLQREAPGLFSDFEFYMAEDRREAARISYHKV
jgi:thymidylate synthase (FAD)